ncbi:MAG: hypothetical protein U5J95_05360 [Balneolaceae bacterium]|nr:hypothetical protein [Balneolaceae bacterium]
MDKQHFLVFDYCGNFEFFDENPEGHESVSGRSVTARIFEKRLTLAGKLDNNPYKHDASLQSYKEELLDLLHQQISNLDHQSIQVRPHLKLAHKLEDRAIWNRLKSNERNEIIRTLSEVIPPNIEEDERTRRFDLLMLRLQHQVLDGTLAKSLLKESAMETAEQLYQKKHIPAVEKALPFVEKAMNEEFWESPEVNELDEIRVALRNLVHLINNYDRTVAFTDFEDELSAPEIEDAVVGEPIINEQKGISEKSGNL